MTELHCNCIQRPSISRRNGEHNSTSSDIHLKPQIKPSYIPQNHLKLPLAFTKMYKVVNSTASFNHQLLFLSDIEGSKLPYKDMMCWIYRGSQTGLINWICYIVTVSCALIHACIPHEFLHQFLHTCSKQSHPSPNQ